MDFQGTFKLTKVIQTDVDDVARTLEFTQHYDAQTPVEARLYDGHTVPTGNCLTVLVNNEDALKGLQLGKSYFVTVTPVSPGPSPETEPKTRETAKTEKRR